MQPPGYCSWSERKRTINAFNKCLVLWKELWRMHELVTSNLSHSSVQPQRNSMVSFPGFHFWFLTKGHGSVVLLVFKKEILSLNEDEIELGTMKGGSSLKECQILLLYTYIMAVDNEVQNLLLFMIFEFQLPKTFYFSYYHGSSCTSESSYISLRQKACLSSCIFLRK